MCCCWQANESVGGFCSSYDYEGCKNDPECVWCLERAADDGTGAGCLHLSRSSVIHSHFLAYLLSFDENETCQNYFCDSHKRYKHQWRPLKKIEYCNVITFLSS